MGEGLGAAIYFRTEATDVVLLSHRDVMPVAARTRCSASTPDVAVIEVSGALHQNETLVLYTDGVTEAHGIDGFYGRTGWRMC
jgi:hypothetical protein